MQIWTLAYKESISLLNGQCFLTSLINYSGFWHQDYQKEMSISEKIRAFCHPEGKFWNSRLDYLRINNTWGKAEDRRNLILTDHWALHKTGKREEKEGGWGGSWLVALPSSILEMGRTFPYHVDSLATHSPSAAEDKKDKLLNLIFR